MSGSISQEKSPPTATEAVTLWENIWSREKEHNREASGINEIKTTMGGLWTTGGCGGDRIRCSQLGKEEFELEGGGSG